MSWVLRSVGVDLCITVRVDGNAGFTDIEDQDGLIRQVRRGSFTTELVG